MDVEENKEQGEEEEDKIKIKVPKSNIKRVLNKETAGKEMKIKILNFL